MKVFRYQVPCDRRWHDLVLTGPIVKVDTRFDADVEVWAIVSGDVVAVTRRFRAFRTGDEVPDTARHVGSAISRSGVFVWHLFEGCPHDTDGDGGCGRIICPFCAPLGARR